MTCVCVSWHVLSSLFASVSTCSDLCLRQWARAVVRVFVSEHVTVACVFVSEHVLWLVFASMDTCCSSCEWRPARTRTTKHHGVRTRRSLEVVRPEIDGNSSSIPSRRRCCVNEAYFWCYSNTKQYTQQSLREVIYPMLQRLAVNQSLAAMTRCHSTVRTP